MPAAASAAAAEMPLAVLPVLFLASAIQSPVKPSSSAPDIQRSPSAPPSSTSPSASALAAAAAPSAAGATLACTFWWPCAHAFGNRVGVQQGNTLRSHTRDKYEGVPGRQKTDRTGQDRSRHTADVRNGMHRHGLTSAAFNHDPRSCPFQRHQQKVGAHQESAETTQYHGWGGAFSPSDPPKATSYITQKYA